jgi:type IV fimbrial biogenesis protein FimT
MRDSHALMGRRDVVIAQDFDEVLVAVFLGFHGTSIPEQVLSVCNSKRDILPQVYRRGRSCAAFRSADCAARRNPLANAFVIAHNPRTMCHSPMSTSCAFVRGFTVIELMITLTLVAILVGVAAPSIREAMMSIRVTGQTNDLMSDLALARSEAARRNVPVVVCSSNNGTTCTNSAWNEGWVVYPDVVVDGVQATNADEQFIKARRKLEGTNALVLNCAPAGVNADKRVTYGSLGSAGGVLKFTLCDSRTTVNGGRIISINTTGRAVATRATCPISVTCP